MDFVQRFPQRSHARLSEQMLSKPLPLMPDNERGPARPPKMTVSGFVGAIPTISPAQPHTQIARRGSYDGG
jgi:hypothetical protein